jgi:hypothetical protein
VTDLDQTICSAIFLKPSDLPPLSGGTIVPAAVNQLTGRSTARHFQADGSGRARVDRGREIRFIDWKNVFAILRKRFFQADGNDLN